MGVGLSLSHLEGLVEECFAEDAEVEGAGPPDAFRGRPQVRDEARVAARRPERHAEEGAVARRLNSMRLLACSSRAGSLSVSSLCSPL